MSGGLLASATQCATWPLSSLTSNSRRQWGLAQNHSVTVPFKVTFFPASNAALPWCAASGTEAIRNPAATAKIASSLFLIGRLHSKPEPPIWASVSRLVRFSCPGHNESMIGHWLDDYTPGTEWLRFTSVRTDYLFELTAKLLRETGMTASKRFSIPSVSVSVRTKRLAT